MASASKNMFTQGSEGGETESGTGAAAPAYGTGHGAFTQRAQVDATWGPSALSSSARLLPFDAAAAYQDAPVPYKATFNKVMPSAEASARLRGLIVHCGAHGQVESIQLALLNAILLSHAKNSGSVLQPDRATFQVAGGKELNFFTDVVAYLGEDTRRFFRAYADMARSVVQNHIAKFKAGDPAFEEDYRDIVMVARQRGLQRFPDLICDSSEACSGLSQAQYDAIGASKMSILARSTNMADLVRNFRVNNPSPSVPRSHDYSGPAGAQVPDY